MRTSEVFFPLIDKISTSVISLIVSQDAAFLNESSSSIVYLNHVNLCAQSVADRMLVADSFESIHYQLQT